MRSGCRKVNLQKSIPWDKKPCTQTHWVYSVQGEVRPLVASRHLNPFDENPFLRTREVLDFDNFDIFLEMVEVVQTRNPNLFHEHDLVSRLHHSLLSERGL